ncbi:MAG: replication-relaxation family protein [Patescibacteria group bacterium]
MGLRNLQRRLHDLYHAGYVERPPQQVISSLPSGHMVYSLGAKRAEFLFEDAEERAEKIRQIKLNQQTTFPYISHALMIFQFRAVITLALEKEKSEAKIVRFRQGVDLKNDLKFRGETPELVPDGFFTIEQDDGRWHFFLEADRSTMILDRFLGKLKIYWEWWREEKYKERLDVSRFRVLTITISKERKENLRRIAKNADPRKTGSNMFFFLSETEYSLKKPEIVLQPIWLSPKDDVKHKVLE